MMLKRNLMKFLRNDSSFKVLAHDADTALMKTKNFNFIYVRSGQYLTKYN